MFNVSQAITHLDRNAKDLSSGYCARYVREALKAGGITLPHIPYAKDFGPHLTANGFVEQFGAGPSVLFPVAGDIVVIQPHTVRVEGHVAMYNGTMWVSDFKQDRLKNKPDRGLWPGSLYKETKPAVKLYRYRGI